MVPSPVVEPPAVFLTHRELKQANAAIAHAFGFIHDSDDSQVHLPTGSTPGARGPRKSGVSSRNAPDPSCGTRAARVRLRLLRGPGKSEARSERASDFPGPPAGVEGARAGHVPQVGRMSRAAQGRRTGSSCAIGRRPKWLRGPCLGKWHRRCASSPALARHHSARVLIIRHPAPAVLLRTAVARRIDALSSQAARSSCSCTRTSDCRAGGTLARRGAPRQAEPRRASLACAAVERHGPALG